LLGFGEFAEGACAAENQDREGRKLGRADAALAIANAEAAEEMDRGGVENVGDLEAVERRGTGGAFLWQFGGGLRRE
jgi:hypothetical protein